MRLVQVVPKLPPAITGVGDYALVLAQGLRRRGWQTSFLAAGELTDRTLGDHAVFGLPAGHRASALVEALEGAGETTVLLQYSGYGYARRGAPVWLTGGLRRWKARGSERRLVIMFHELFLTYRELLRRGRPWQSSFWLTPAQRYVAGGLAASADICLTNCDLYASMLRHWMRNGADVAVVPVFSNVGEPRDCMEFSRRSPVAVVFGSASRRLAVHQRLRALLPVLQTAAIETVIDIGPPIAGLPDTVAGIEVHALGVLPADEVSERLGQARLGLLHYPVAKLAKSGAFAAMAAHGVVPLVADLEGASSCQSQLQPWEHFLPLRERPSVDARQIDLPLCEKISLRVRAWYDRHGSLHTTETFHMALQELAEERQAVA